MAVQSPVYTPTASQWASATMHLENRIEHVRFGGNRFAVVTSSNSGRVYRLPADASSCPCVWNTKTRTQCSHMLAVELAALEDELREVPVPAPKRLKTLEELWPTCRAAGCQDDPEPGEQDCWRHVLIDAF